MLVGSVGARGGFFGDDAERWAGVPRCRLGPRGRAKFLHSRLVRSSAEHFPPAALHSEASICTRFPHTASRACTSPSAASCTSCTSTRTGFPGYEHVVVVDVVDFVAWGMGPPESGGHVVSVERWGAEPGGVSSGASGVPARSGACEIFGGGLSRHGWQCGASDGRCGPSSGLGGSRGAAVAPLSRPGGVFRGGQFGPAAWFFLFAVVPTSVDPSSSSM